MKLTHSKVTLCILNKCPYSSIDNHQTDIFPFLIWYLYRYHATDNILHNSSMYILVFELIHVLNETSHQKYIIREIYCLQYFITIDMNIYVQSCFTDDDNSGYIYRRFLNNNLYAIMQNILFYFSLQYNTWIVITCMYLV